MANKNTKLARSRGFASMTDLLNNGTKVHRGSSCNTEWNAPASKRKSPRVYKSVQK